MNIISRINDLLKTSQVFCLATVISSSDRDIGSGNKTIVFHDGSFEGGTGKKELDDLIRNQAVQVMNEQKKQMIEIMRGTRVFFDIVAKQSKLVICGAGHIAKPLAQFARKVGFSVTVIDDRPDFANPSYFEGCKVIAEDFMVALQNVQIDQSTFVVVITRGHEHDVECLTAILPRTTGYVGLIGSRRRGGIVLEMLSRKGFLSEKEISEYWKQKCKILEFRNVNEKFPES